MSVCSDPSTVLLSHPTAALRSSSSVRIPPFHRGPGTTAKADRSPLSIPAMDIDTRNGSSTPWGSLVPRQSGTVDAAFGFSDNLGTPDTNNFVAQ